MGALNLLCKKSKTRILPEIQLVSDVALLREAQERESKGLCATNVGGNSQRLERPCFGRFAQLQCYPEPKTRYSPYGDAANGVCYCAARLFRVYTLLLALESQLGTAGCNAEWLSQSR